MSEPESEDISNMIAKLTAPFPVDELEFRVMQKSKDQTKGTCFAYIKAQAITNRLNEVFGMQWEYSSTKIDAIQSEIDYKGVKRSALKVAFSGRLTVYIDGYDHVSRVGVGEHFSADQSFDVYKSAETDAFKRTASKFGIGEYLYKVPTLWLPIDQWGNFTVNPATILFNSDGSVNPNASYGGGYSAPASTTSTTKPDTAIKVVEGTGKSFDDWLMENGWDSFEEIDYSLTNPTPPSDKQIKYILTLYSKKDIAPADDLFSISSRDASAMIKALLA